MSVATTPLWLVIVRPDRQDLYWKLRRSYQETPLVAVIFDRRQTERRRSGGAVPGERRRRDRRRPFVPAGDSQADGYRVVQRADGFQVLQAQARVSADCPECGAVLAFEMPHFGELPARIDFRVIHTDSRSAGSRHAVEAQASRASGRPFLACRIVARLRAGATRASALGELASPN